MGIYPSPGILFTILLISAFLHYFTMDVLRMGSLNVNGLRARNKWAMLKECIKLKEFNVMFLQETHSDINNEVDWGLWFDGQCVLSHGTNFSAGVAILFSPELDVKILSIDELEKGRLLLIKAKIKDMCFVFVNIYAPNIGKDRIKLFEMLKDTLVSLSQEDVLILGGDFNCTPDFVIDRIGEEPHPPSVKVLKAITSQFGLVDVWREKNKNVRQYSWLKVAVDRVSAARLDRFYLHNSLCNRVIGAYITPCIISDHQLISMNVVLSETKPQFFYWRFDIKLLQDVNFYENFKMFWNCWVEEKNDYENLLQWWEIGKTQIKLFCQQFMVHTSCKVKYEMAKLEKDISKIQNMLIDQNNVNLQDDLSQKRQELSQMLNEKVKRALVKSHFVSVHDMDAPTTFFFNLNKKCIHTNYMHALRTPDGNVTSDPLEMRRLAVDFYVDLYAKECTGNFDADELFNNLPVLDEENVKDLDSDLSFEEVTKAVNQLSSGRAPGIDGLPAEFYKTFWGIIGKDFFKVVQEIFKAEALPKSCQRAVLSLIPKKGDLCLLKNWRPVAVLCSDYKILSKCLANRLKGVLDVLVQKDQTYCVPKRSIYDNLFLMRDIMDYAGIYNVDFGLLSLDQEKAFDRVDHHYLFKVLKCYGFGEHFLSWIRILYADAVSMVKIGGGLSVPIQMNRGIRQGCPMSGQLYTLAIEPLLCLLRRKLTGILVSNKPEADTIKLSAYADDITLMVRNSHDVQVIKEALKMYEGASSAKLNWQKTEALWCGCERNPLPELPGNVKWGMTGFKFLGVYLGKDECKMKNWEGLVEGVLVKLSKWQWLLPQLSYRGRVLIANNLIASTLWHKLMVLDPPKNIIEDIQKTLVKFFWSGQHWLKAAVLYLPVHEGGQGLIDIWSRIAVFRLQVAQRLLYGQHQQWMDVACALLQKNRRMGLDKQWFVMSLDGLALEGLVGFYKSVLQAWQTLSCSREREGSNQWIYEEPLFFNPCISVELLSSATVRSAMLKAGVSKICHLRRGLSWISVEELAQKVGFRSERLIKRMLEDLEEVLPVPIRDIMKVYPVENCYDGGNAHFPELHVSIKKEDWQEDGRKLLSMEIPELNVFSNLSRQTLYRACVKTINFQHLKDVRDTKWTMVFDSGSSPKGSWRSLYKRPIEKRVGDLQWRIVHGILATNRHKALLNVSDDEGCPFCGVPETVFHLFIECQRLGIILGFMESWSLQLMGKFNRELFIFGPKYTAKYKSKVVLLNYLFGAAKLAIWCTRRNKVEGRESVDIVLMMRGFIKKRLMMEFAYFSLINDVNSFFHVWGIDGVLCEADDQSGFVLNL